MRDGYCLHYCALTDPGCRRTHNEDAFLVDEEGLMFAVADGVGGLGGGEIASNMALAEFSSCFNTFRSKLCTPSTRLRRAIERANTAVFRHGHEHGKRIATTLSLMILQGQQAFIANVGDSRVYLWRHKRLRQLTTDHTVRQEMMENGLLSGNTPGPPGIDHLITRAVGAEEQVNADITPFSVEPGDSYLVCSDGVTSMLSDEEIQHVLGSMASPVQAGKVLVENAKAAGGNDNITLILFTVNQPEAGGKMVTADWS